MTISLWLMTYEYDSHSDTDSFILNTDSDTDTHTLYSDTDSHLRVES